MGKGIPGREQLVFSDSVVFSSLQFSVTFSFSSVYLQFLIKALSYIVSVQ